MKNKYIPSLFFVLFVLLVASCRHNSNETDIPTANDPLINDLETVSASITGIVVNENNIPLTGITVTSGGNNAVTDRYGIFRFRNITMSKNNAVVKVVQNGYFTAYRTFPATAGRTHNVRIKLIPKTNTGSITAAAGGTINITGGGKLVIPANAISDASGNAYSGNVNVATTWINPTAPDLNSVIPGDLRGITTGGQERALETYGMLGVELTGAGGQTLKIASGKTAQLTFPIPAALQASAPASIPLWHFDEATARWKEEGSATKTGNAYEGNVSHFSFWNCDAPWPQITLCMTLQTPNSLPLSNVAVRIRRANIPASSATGITDSLGNLCGIVPKNEPLVMEVLGPCGNVVYTQNIGPFSANTSLGNITVTIPAANQVTVTGTVTGCNNNPVPLGYVLIYVAGGGYTHAPVVNGNYTVSLLNCSGNLLSFSVIPVDNATQQQGPGVAGSGTSGSVNMGNIQACGTNIAQFIDMLIDGVPHSWAQNDSIAAYPHNPVPPQLFGAFCTGLRFSLGGISQTDFRISFNNTPGSYPLHHCMIDIGGNASQTIVSPGPQVQLTEIGPSNSGYLAGSFNIQMQFFIPTTTVKTVQCNFRLRRY